MTPWPNSSLRNEPPSGGAPRETPRTAQCQIHTRHAANANGIVPVKPRNLKKSKPVSGLSILPPAILYCVQRVLGDIDVCVGDAKVRCNLRLHQDTVALRQLRGRVFFAECVDPGECLSKLAKLRGTGAVDEVVVALPAETAAAWFKDLAGGAWVWCFPTGVQPPLLLAHLGHHHAFCVAFSELGAVMRPA